MDTGGYPSELPHSVILGSQAMCAYPKLIAAYHDLLRLLMPRHPPCTLYSLIFKVTYAVLAEAKNGLFFAFSLYAVFKEHRKASLPWVRDRSWTLSAPEVLSKLNRIRILQPKRWWKASMFAHGAVPCPEGLTSGRLPRKEVIQPQVLLRLPCYDFTPIADPTFGRWLLAVAPRTSGIANSHGVTGGVYKARERIHRDMLIRDY